MIKLKYKILWIVIKQIRKTKERKDTFEPRITELEKIQITTIITLTKETNSLEHEDIKQNTRLKT